MSNDTTTAEAQARAKAHEVLGFNPEVSDRGQSYSGVRALAVRMAAVFLTYERTLAEVRRERDRFISERNDMTKRAFELEQGIASVRAERIVAEDAAENALCQRDHFEEQVGELVAQAGLDCEWSNLHGHATCIGEAFDSLRASLASMTVERDEAVGKLAIALDVGKS